MIWIFQKYTGSVVLLFRVLLSSGCHATSYNYVSAVQAFNLSFLLPIWYDANGSGEVLTCFCGLFCLTSALFADRHTLRKSSTCRKASWPSNVGSGLKVSVGWFWSVGQQLPAVTGETSMGVWRVGVPSWSWRIWDRGPNQTFFINWYCTRLLWRHTTCRRIRRYWAFYDSGKPL